MHTHSRAYTHTLNLLFSFIIVHIYLCLGLITCEWIAYQDSFLDFILLLLAAIVCLQLLTQALVFVRFPLSTLVWQVVLVFCIMKAYNLFILNFYFIFKYVCECVFLWVHMHTRVCVCVCLCMLGGRYMKHPENSITSPRIAAVAISYQMWVLRIEHCSSMRADPLFLMSVFLTFVPSLQSLVIS